MSGTGLRLEGLGCWRGSRPVLRGLDLSLAPGRALLLTGPNGSGKSTLLRVVAGLVPADAGAMLWDGCPALEDPAEHAARVAYLGHADALKPALTVREQLVLARGLAGERLGAADIRAALAAVGLAALDGLAVRALSAGQRRRLALACRLQPQRPLWLLDEPANGLDSASIAQFEALIAAHCARGGMALVATHLPLLAALEPQRLDLQPPRLAGADAA